MDQSAKFSDIYISGYHVLPVNDSNIEDCPVFLKKDIRLYKQNSNYQLLNEHCLFTVNGFYHNSFLNDQIIIKDAYKSMLISKQHQIGIYSFRNVGKINKVTLTDEMLFTNNDMTVTINLPNIDFINKQIFIIIGGYFHILDNIIFSQVGTNSFKIDFNRFSLLDRFFELKKFIDISNLGLTFPINNPELVNINELHSDVVLKNILKLSQSFIVVLDTPSIEINKLFNIKKTGFPGQYISYKEPIYPLVSGWGRHAEYIKEKEERFLSDRPFNMDQWAVHIRDNIVYNRLYSSTLKNYLDNTNGDLRPAYPGELSDAYFLEIKKI